jgi:hypothetical protein
MKIVLALSTCLLLGACQNLPPANQPTPSPSATASATPTPSASPVASHVYALPLTVSLAPECSGEEMFTQYEVLADGTFRYPTSTEAPNLFQEPTNLPLSTTKLTQAQVDGLKAIVMAQDLEKAFAATTPVPADAPQTAECRTVSILKLQVDSTPKSYALNGRTRNITEDYSKRWQAIRTHLESLADTARDNTPIPTEPEYAFPPLRFEVEGECDMGTRTLYEIEGLGQFKAYDNDGKVTTDRALTEEEQTRLRTALNEADLNTRLEDSKTVPADAPQTRECRMIEKVTLPVYGVPKTFDRNSREYSHTEAYIAGFNAVKAVLEDFAK